MNKDRNFADKSLLCCVKSAIFLSEDYFKYENKET